DVLVQYKRDNRGQIIEEIDGENNKACFEYDAFKQCIHEYLPVNNITPSLHIEHQYEARGLEVKTIKSTKDENLITVEKQYQHYLGKKTHSIDELGKHTEWVLDTLGRVQIEKCYNDKESIIVEANEYDAFSRPIKITDADNTTVTIDYDRKNRTQTIQHTSDNSQTVIHENV